MEYFDEPLRIKLVRALLSLCSGPFILLDGVGELVRTYFTEVRIPVQLEIQPTVYEIRIQSGNAKRTIPLAGKLTRSHRVPLKLSPGYYRFEMVHRSPSTGETGVETVEVSIQYPPRLLA